MYGCAFPLLMLVLVLPFLFALFFFNVAALSFTKLGLSPEGAFLLLMASLVGGMINIPISRRRYLVEKPRFPMSFIFYYPPQVREQVVAVNVGGAVIPVLFSLYLLPRAPLTVTILAAAAVTLVAKALARPVPGIGIQLPAFIPPIVAAIIALILAGQNAAPVAYIAGVWGTLLGADILNYHRFKQLGAQVLSIGGAGVFDGIFLVGIVAALLA